MPSRNVSTAYLILTGVIVVGVAGIFAFVRPLSATVQELRADITASQAQLGEREEFLRTLDQKIAALTREATHEAQLNVVLPVSSDTQDVVRLVHQAQVASGGAVRRLDNITAGLQGAANARRARAEGAAALPADIVPLGFEIDFTGSYQQLRVFLGELERAPRLLDIARLEIQRNLQTPDSVTAHLTAQFYRYEPPQK